MGLRPLARRPCGELSFESTWCHEQAVENVDPSLDFGGFAAAQRCDDCFDLDGGFSRWVKMRVARRFSGGLLERANHLTCVLSVAVD